MPPSLTSDLCAALSQIRRVHIELLFIRSTFCSLLTRHLHIVPLRGLLRQDLGSFDRRLMVDLCRNSTSAHEEFADFGSHTTASMAAAADPEHLSCAWSAPQTRLAPYPSQLPQSRYAGWSEEDFFSKFGFKWPARRLPLDPPPREHSSAPSPSSYLCSKLAPFLPTSLRTLGGNCVTVTDGPTLALRQQAVVQQSMRQLWYIALGLWEARDEAEQDRWWSRYRREAEMERNYPAFPFGKVWKRY